MANLESIYRLDKWTMTLIHQHLSEALKQEENQLDPADGMVEVSKEVCLDVTGQVGRRESFERTRYAVKWREEFANAEMQIGAIFRVLEGLLSPSMIEEVRRKSEDRAYQLDTELGSLRVEKKIKKLKEDNAVTQTVRGTIKTHDDLVSLIVRDDDEPSAWDYMEDVPLDEVRA